MAKKAFAFTGIFAVLLMSLAMVSAATTYVNSTEGYDIELTVNQTSFSNVSSGEVYSFKAIVNNSGAEDITAVVFGTSGWSTAITENVSAGTSQEFVGTLTIPSSGNKNLYAKIYNISNSSQEIVSLAQYITLSYYSLSNTTTPSDPYNFCGIDYNDSEIEIKSIRDKSNTKNKWEWRPLDDIELNVKIENLNDDDEFEYDVRLVFYRNGQEVEMAEDEDDLEEEGIDIDEGKSKEITFNFVVNGDGDEVVDASNYNLYVVVEREDGLCFFKSLDDIENENIEINKEKHEVVVKDIKGSNSVKAGTTEVYEVKVANIGKEDQEKVKIIAYNSELGIKVEKEIEDLDEGDVETVSFMINFPTDAEGKVYKIRFSTEFDYDDDDEEYDRESDTEDDILYSVTILESANNGELPVLDISANLLSSAKVGEELSVEVSIKNNGDDSQNVVVSAGNIDAWGELVSVQPQIVSIPAGSTKTSTIKILPNKSGTQTFMIQAIVNGETIEQPVSITIAEKTGLFTGAFAGVGTLGLVLIGAIVVILILIIITLIVKGSGTRRIPAEF